MSTPITPDEPPLIDPDCRDGKCSSCVGGPCEHSCHEAGRPATAPIPAMVPASSGRGERVTAALTVQDGATRDGA